MGVAGISYASACGHNCGECQEIQLALKPLNFFVSNDDVGRRIKTCKTSFGSEPATV